MKKLFCDRCGKEIDYSQGAPVFSITRTNSGMIMDMCKECREDLINFMHDTENKKEESEQEPPFKWVHIDSNDFTDFYKCPVCGHIIRVNEEFMKTLKTCPNCNADMEGATE